MTADFYPFDMRFLGRAATRIINEVKATNRVVYDVTSKPRDDRVRGEDNVVFCPRIPAPQLPRLASFR
jgi:hypothetical protein